MIKIHIHNQAECDLLVSRFSKKLKISSIEGLALGDKTKVLDIEVGKKGLIAGPAL